MITDRGLVGLTRVQLFRASRTAYLRDEEVHVLLDEHIQLLLEDGLDVGFALAAQVGRGLRDPPGHQGVALVGHLPGQVAGCLVDLRSLWARTPGHTTIFISQFISASASANSNTEKQTNKALYSSGTSSGVHLRTLPLP